MYDYDESIEVCEDDDDEYEQFVTDRRRAGVSPVRRPPFHQNQRPSRSFGRSRPAHRSESLEMSADEGSPAPPGPPPEELKSGKKLSSKDFAQSSPQQSVDSGGKPENLISMASSYAKKLMSSGDRKKVKLLRPSYDYRHLNLN